MTQRGEEFAKLPAGPSPRPPGRLAGGHSWVPGTLRPRPAPRRGVGGRTSALWLRPQLEAGGLAWLRLGGLALRFPLLPPPPFQMYNVNVRKSSRKKGAENFLMRKGITSGGRREPEYCVSVSLISLGKKLWGRETGLFWRPANRDSPCLPGPLGCLGSGQLDWGLCSPVTKCSQTASWSSYVGLAAAPLQADRVESIGVLGSLTLEH